jgi:hypothetical protein
MNAERAQLSASIKRLPPVVSFVEGQSFVASDSVRPNDQREPLGG